MIPALALIRIGLYERDTFFWFTEDRVCDVSPREGETVLTVGCDRETGRITSDASSQRGHMISA